MLDANRDAEARYSDSAGLRGSKEEGWASSSSPSVILTSGAELRPPDLGARVAITNNRARIPNAD